MCATHFQFAVEDNPLLHLLWGGVAADWYTCALHQRPQIGRLYHHLAILERDVQAVPSPWDSRAAKHAKLAWYGKSLWFSFLVLAILWPRFAHLSGKRNTYLQKPLRLLLCS